MVPALLGLKGNLEMTLASRLSTHANLGHLDKKENCLSMIVGNMALIQVGTRVRAHRHPRKIVQFFSDFRVLIPCDFFYVIPIFCIIAFVIHSLSVLESTFSFLPKSGVE